MKSNKISTKKFAVILAGCGVYDGAEIHEATMTMYAIQKLDHQYQLFAPDMDQHHVINHLTGKEMAETRNVLVESARIARGNIKSLTEFNADEFDALVLPGGFGAAKNLSNFAFAGAGCKVNNEVEKAIRAMIAASKPVGALCISPVILAKILRDVKITVGQDPDVSLAVQAMGATHISTTHREIVVDEKHKVVTTPCYMLDASLTDIAVGAEKTIKALIDLME